MKKIFVGFIIGYTLGIVGTYYFLVRPEKNKAKKFKDLSDKHLSLFILMQKWVKQKIKGKQISRYLSEKSIKNVAIYGMNYVGEALYEELNKNGIRVLYGIDMNADKMFSDIDIYKPSEELPDVDAIIVTPIHAYDVIEESMSKKMDCLIMSIEDIIYEM